MVEWCGRVVISKSRIRVIGSWRGEQEQLHSEVLAGRVKFTGVICSPLPGYQTNLQVLDIALCQAIAASTLSNVASEAVIAKH